MIPIRLRVVILLMAKKQASEPEASSNMLVIKIETKEGERVRLARSQTKVLYWPCRSEREPAPCMTNCLLQYIARIISQYFSGIPKLASYASATAEPSAVLASFGRHGGFNQSLGNLHCLSCTSTRTKTKLSVPYSFPRSSIR